MTHAHISVKIPTPIERPVRKLESGMSHICDVEAQISRPKLSYANASRAFPVTKTCQRFVTHAFLGVAVFFGVAFALAFFGAAFFAVAAFVFVTRPDLVFPSTVGFFAATAGACMVTLAGILDARMWFTNSRGSFLHRLPGLRDIRLGLGRLRGLWRSNLFAGCGDLLGGSLLGSGSFLQLTSQTD